MARFSDLDEYLGSIADDGHREAFAALLARIAGTWPDLECQVKWNQPMFTHHGTFIIGFTALAHHITVGPERRALARAMPEIERLGLTHGTKTFRIGYDETGDDTPQWKLLSGIIDWTIVDKRDVTTFWDKRGVDES